MIATAGERRPVSRKVDPGFIAAVMFLRPACSVQDIATILNCDRKRVLTVLARLAQIGVPVVKDERAPRFRPLTPAQQAEVTTLFNNGRGLEFYAICRVMRDVHPLTVFVFLRNEVGPRRWWMRACGSCDQPFATPRSAVRFCSSRCAARREPWGSPRDSSFGNFGSALVVNDSKKGD